ncbi:hypothetical protein ANN_06297 [Periplaneta americana]|uniref:BAH domain-containing protein n=1 Tax=Periplaneta americana TaxID=6978 RepID=A0ABQ8TD90_PERAM|nr:hypothetical protein ANN_06297 [Periplaneta americana]
MRAVLCSPCQLTQTHLNTENQRALTVMGGLFYAGTISAIRAPDVYGITLDGERGNRPHIYSREEILRDAIMEVRPTNISELTPGTRLCAYWSQQYRCLYPGTVAQPSSPDPQLDLEFVNVEFDDGDSGRINLVDIRLLPTDYPIVDYDPNPLLTLGKRRRRNSGASCESHSKDRRASAEVAGSSPNSNNNNVKNGATTQKQVPQTKETPEIPDGNATESTEKKQQLSASSTSKASSSVKNSNSSSSSQVSSVTVPASTVKTSAINSTTETLKVPTDVDVTGKTEMSDRSSSSSSGRERKRLKKRRREKLKRLLASATGEGGLAIGLKKHRKKHRCSGGEEHCRHKRHHKRHRKHRHRNHNSSRNKDSSSGSSSAESGSRPGHPEGDVLSRLSPVLEQLDILEIQQTAIRQLATEQEVAAATVTTAITTTTVPAAAAAATKTSAVQSTATTDVEESESEAEQEEEEEEADKTPELPKSTGSSTDTKKSKKEKEAGKPKKGRDRQPSVESRSKMAAFLPARQLWGWSGRGFKRPGAKGRGKKEFYKAIQRGKETIHVGDCAVFLSTGRPDRPYIGRIESMWESWGTNMVVRVKWFYHPEETNGCPAQLQYPGALFESPHVDENDVQTISHKCEVLPLEGYTCRLGSEPQRYSTVYDNNDIYYLAGYYDPTTSQLTIEPGVV